MFWLIERTATNRENDQLKLDDRSDSSAEMEEDLERPGRAHQPMINRGQHAMSRAQAHSKCCPEVRCRSDWTPS